MKTIHCQLLILAISVNLSCVREDYCFDDSEQATAILATTIRELLVDYSSSGTPRDSIFLTVLTSGSSVNVDGDSAMVICKYDASLLTNVTIFRNFSEFRSKKYFDPKSLFVQIGPVVVIDKGNIGLYVMHGSLQEWVVDLYIFNRLSNDLVKKEFVELIVE